MPKPAQPSRCRSLLSFSEAEWDQLVAEAKQKGLRLATHLRALIRTHPERASGAGNR